MPLQAQYQLSTIVTAVTVLALGAFVFLKNPKSRANQLWALFNLAVAGWSIPQSIYIVSHTASDAYLLVRLSYVFGVLWIATFYLHFVWVYLQRRNLRPIYFSYAFSLIYLTQVWNPAFLEPPRQKFSLNYYPEPGPLYYPFFIIWSGLVTYSLLELHKELKRSNGVHRNQLRYLFYAMCIGYVGGMSNYLPVFNVERFPYTPYGTYGIPLYVAIFTYAIVKHHLMDIDVVIRKSLVYSVLVALITATYLVIVVLAERLLQGVMGYRSVIGTVLAAFVIALGFTPMKNVLQRWVDRLFFGGSQEMLAEENERLRKELIRSERLKSVALLASGLAHEIKNPLSAIKTFTDYLPERHADEAFAKKFHRIVSQELEKIHATVQNLLTFAKPQPLQQERVWLANVVQDTLTLLNEDCLKRKVILEAAVNPSACVTGDRTRLKQVLLNLCLNSLEAMDGGGTLRVESSLDDGHAMLSVRDTGKGIAVEDLPHVFDPFFTTKETGTGLGLSVVHGIVKEHGGTIHIESQPGQGTKVQIKLPTSV